MNTLKPSQHYKAKARMQHHCDIYVRDSFPRGGKSEILIINTIQGAVYNYMALCFHNLAAEVALYNIHVV